MTRSSRKKTLPQHPKRTTNITKGAFQRVPIFEKKNKILYLFLFRIVNVKDTCLTLKKVVNKDLSTFERENNLQVRSKKEQFRNLQIEILNFLYHCLSKSAMYKQKKSLLQITLLKQPLPIK